MVRPKAVNSQNSPLEMTQAETGTDMSSALIGTDIRYHLGTEDRLILEGACKVGNLHIQLRGSQTERLQVKMDQAIEELAAEFKLRMLNWYSGEPVTRMPGVEADFRPMQEHVAEFRQKFGLDETPGPIRDAHDAHHVIFKQGPDYLGEVTVVNPVSVFGAGENTLVPGDVATIVPV